MRTRLTFSRSVMVSVAVSSLGHTDLFFIDQGAKVNSQYDGDVLLHHSFCQPFATCLATSLLFSRTILLPIGCETVQLLTCETPDFTAPALTSQLSYLNPIDYQTWGKHRSWMHDVDQLKSRPIEEGTFPPGVRR